jgi:hypothetical protein
MEMIVHLFMISFKKRVFCAHNSKKLCSAQMVIIAILDTALKIQSLKIFHCIKITIALFTKKDFAKKDINANL